MSTTLSMKFKWKLRSVMADKKMSVTRLAKLMGLNRGTVSGWVASDELPSFREAHKTLQEITDHLDCALSDLFEEVSN